MSQLENLELIEFHDATIESMNVDTVGMRLVFSSMFAYFPAGSDDYEVWECSGLLRLCRISKVDWIPDAEAESFVAVGEVAAGGLFDANDDELAIAKLRQTIRQDCLLRVVFASGTRLEVRANGVWWEDIAKLKRHGNVGRV